MSELPNGWAETSLGELGVWKGGGTPSKHDQSFWGGDIPWVSPKDMKAPEIHDTVDHITPIAIEKSATNLVPPNTLLVVNRSGILSHTFPVAITKREVSLNQDLKALIPTPGLSPSFIHQALRCNGQDILATCSKAGTTVASVEFEKLKAYKIKLPPLNEQHRIVTKLEKCEARIGAAREALDEVPKLLEQYRQSVLAAAFRGDLTRDWRAANPKVEPASQLLTRLRQERRQKWEQAELEKYKAKGKTPPKDWKNRYQQPEPVSGATAKDLPEIPGNWLWTRYDETSSEITVGHVGPMRNNYHDDGIPFLRSQNVRPMRFTPENLVFIDETFDAKLKKSRLFGNEIILTRSGANVGQCCVYPSDFRQANCSDLVITRPLTGFCPEFGALYMNSPLGRAMLHLNKVGNAQAHFNVGSMKTAPVPLPSEQEQRKIVAIVKQLFDTFDNLTSAYQITTTDLSTLTQSLLAKAFRGELVPQDPNDEPASVLLERIRARDDSKKARG